MKESKIILIFGFCILNFIGCARIIEGTKGFVGISTRALEDAKPYSLKQTFNYDYNTCYSKVQDTLKNIGAYIYAKDTKKNMLAVYVSSEDTTPVGIFFKAVDTANTQIEVSSPSTSAKELIAKIIFKALSPEKEKGKD